MKKTKDIREKNKDTKKASTTLTNYENEITETLTTYGKHKKNTKAG